MAKGYKLVYGTDSLKLSEKDDKVYYPGDMVPITEEQARNLGTAGILFEGIETGTEGETASLEVAAPGLVRKS